MRQCKTERYIERKCGENEQKKHIEDGVLLWYLSWFMNCCDISCVESSGAAQICTLLTLNLAFHPYEFLLSLRASVCVLYFIYMCSHVIVILCIPVSKTFKAILLRARTTVSQSTPEIIIAFPLHAIFTSQIAQHVLRQVTSQIFQTHLTRG